jgi:hypothetical protein
MQKRILIGLFSIVLSACAMSEDANDSFYIVSYTADFSQSVDQWEADFADYPAGKDDSIRYELTSSKTSLPPTLASRQSALMISGNNYNNDLFMFIKRKVDGLSPNTAYTIVFDVQLASNTPGGETSTINDEPGESIYLKVGAVPKDPKKVIHGDSYRMNIDKGNQGDSGADMTVIGNIGVIGSTANSSYALVTRSNSTNNAPITARTNSAGELWLIVGTDSAFKGTTTLYYTRIDVVFSANN